MERVSIACLCLVLLQATTCVSDDNVDGSGFISIDCGFNDDSEVDVRDSITYTSDADFIDSGQNKRIAPEILSNASVPQNSYWATLRSFPKGKKNCYTLKPSRGKGHPYLIRASFMHGNYDGSNSWPRFDVYIGVNFWFQLQWQTANATQKVFVELIHVPTEDYIFVCLVNIGQGRPFINALELRPLIDSAYNASSEYSLKMERRYDLGTSAAGGWISYVSDAYDRMWDSSSLDQWVCFSPNNSIKTSDTGAYRLPPRVLGNAVRPENGSLLSYWFRPNIQNLKFYVYWHFDEIERLRRGQLREFSILETRSGFKTRPLSPKYLQPLTIVSTVISLQAGKKLEFFIRKTNGSTLPPILNALEIYSVLSLPQQPTYRKEVDAIMDVKQKCGVTSIWQGDPCVPATWNGLNCGTKDHDVPSIISLDLASSGLSGELPPSLSNLTSLKFLNLSNNRFTGLVPEFLCQLPSLQVIDLSKNKLSGSVPQKLIEKSNNGSLDLRLAGNPNLCMSKQCDMDNKKKKSSVHAKFLAPVVASVTLFVLLLIAVLVFWMSKIRTKSGWSQSKNQSFTYSEVLGMTNNFQKVIGRGGFATVYQGILKDGTQVAVKKLNPSSEIFLKSFQAEARLLSTVHHRNLVSLVGYCDEGATKALIYEYMSKGNLQEHLSGNIASTLSWRERLQISVDAAQGLDYLHSGCRPPIIHRDMKTANILLDDQLRAKISDFGLSKYSATDSQSYISSLVAGTQGYIDPELPITGRLNEKSDVYALGIVLLELVTGQTAIIRGTNSVVHIVNWIEPFISRGDIRSILDPRLRGDRFNINSAWKLVETAMACVAPTAIQRPAMDQVLSELKECLEIETAHDGDGNTGHETNPYHPAAQVTVTYDSDMYPVAR